MKTKSTQESTSFPNIKRLVWKKTGGGDGIEAITPFGSYEIYKRRNEYGFTLWWFNEIPYVFEKEFEAIEFAQNDFETRVRQCLEEDEA